MAQAKNGAFPKDLAKRINITNVSPTVAFTENGQVERMVNIEFTVDGKGPFSQQVRSADFDEKLLLQQVMTFADKICKLLALEV